MHIPFFSSNSRRKLYRRKGGGGKGGGGGAKGGGTGAGAGAGKSTSVSTGAGAKSATSYGSGGGKAVSIPAGQPFAGRLSGGGTRNDVYGNSQYGSGYPGIAGRGVQGRSFPFGFWPLAWGGVGGLGAAAYLHSTEYGRPDNTSRPGGIMMTAAFSSTSQNTTFRVIADNATVTELIGDIATNCSTVVKSPTSITATAYNDSSPDPPKPEQAVQYYRASSVALTLDGYNNSAALQAEGTPDTPLPNGIDTNLLNCLNFTIGAAVPLIDGGNLRWSPPTTFGLIGLVWLIRSFTSMV